MTELKWPLCKLCKADLRKTGETKRTHLKKHGYKTDNPNIGSLNVYFTSEEYL